MKRCIFLRVVLLARFLVACNLSIIINKTATPTVRHYDGAARTNQTARHPHRPARPYQAAPHRHVAGTACLLLFCGS